MFEMPNDWGSIQGAGDSSRPPYDGYVCIIKNVKDNAERERFEFEVDIAEGEFKGYAVDVMERFGYWPLTFTQKYSGKSIYFLKNLINIIEATNNGFRWDGKPQSLVGKGIGCILGERQYWGKDGTLKSAYDISNFRTALQIRNKEYEVPAAKPPKDTNPPAAVTSPTFTELTKEEEEAIPF